jgi:rhomboid protease GluP
VLSNSYLLFFFGRQVERVYGSARFLTIYLLAGLYGSLVSFAFGPNLSTGASGAIFGLQGAMIAYFRRHRQTLGTWGAQLLLKHLVIACFIFVLGVSVPGIDNMVNLGGLLAGMALGWLLAPEYRVQVDVQGQACVTDQTSLRSRWWVIALAILLLIAGTSVAVAVQQESASALIMRGQRALKNGDFTTAESLFRQAATRDPDSGEVLFYLGVALSEQGKMTEAIPTYQDSLRLEPKLAEAHWNLALAYAALNRPVDAIAEFEAFIALRPDSPNADQARAFIDELTKSVP